jgi:hypothetical protein
MLCGGIPETPMTAAAVALAALLATTDPAPPPAPTLAAVAFMAGHWSSLAADGATSEELWLAPRGGLMVGVNRSVSARGKASFEFLRMEVRAGEVWYLASPGGAPPTPFRMSASSASSATFENPAHDFPKRIAYRLEDGALVARIDGGSTAPDKSMEWRWTRAAP